MQINAPSAKIIRNWVQNSDAQALSNWADEVALFLTTPKALDQFTYLSLDTQEAIAASAEFYWQITLAKQLDLQLAQGFKAIQTMIYNHNWPDLTTLAQQLPKSKRDQLAAVFRGNAYALNQVALPEDWRKVLPTLIVDLSDQISASPTLKHFLMGQTHTPTERLDFAKAVNDLTIAVWQTYFSELKNESIMRVEPALTAQDQIQIFNVREDSTGQSFYKIPLTDAHWPNPFALLHPIVHEPVHGVQKILVRFADDHTTDKLQRWLNYRKRFLASNCPSSVFASPAKDALEHAAYQAYRAMPHEAPAFAVGDLINWRTRHTLTGQFPPEDERMISYANLLGRSVADLRTLITNNKPSSPRVNRRWPANPNYAPAIL